MDPRADVFALGVVMYELLCGRRCFAAENEFALMNRVARGEYVPVDRLRPDVPAVVVDVVRNALEVQPDLRTPSAAALVRELDRAAATIGLEPSAAAARDFMARVRASTGVTDVGPLERSATIVPVLPGHTEVAPVRASKRPRRLAVALGSTLAVATLAVVALQASARDESVATASAPVSTAIESVEATPARADALPLPAETPVAQAIALPPVLGAASLPSAIERTPVATSPAAASSSASAEPVVRAPAPRARATRADAKSSRTSSSRTRAQPPKPSHLDRLFLE
jgi:hypothetical protein